MISASGKNHDIIRLALFSTNIVTIHAIHNNKSMPMNINTLQYTSDHLAIEYINLCSVYCIIIQSLVTPLTLPFSSTSALKSIKYT